ncbi:MAG: single-stranded-DNA-specific exonuclease RecJ [Firmicutes bacterium]|nr:single-stranded-DNA-specific exonuclease RecJ [Bacillota bacterium]
MANAREIIETILHNRGIHTAEETEEFLSDRPQKTYDPFLLTGMKEGVDLLLSEIRAGSRICIYGDYDADGVTATCIMAACLKRLTSNYFFYIPSRMAEGYGLNKGAIDRIIEQGADLILTVDCGCVSYNEVEYAKSKGLKVIVTDHHNIEDVIADCIVINPKHPDNQYPFRHLAGCGVAYKFVQAVQRTADLPREVLTETLDLAAIGTIGDIVPLLDENRTITKYGIYNCNSGGRQGLRHLADEISLKEIDSENIAFGIVPHINAAGRMGTATDAVDLFLADDEATIRSKTQQLITYNRQRKDTQEVAYRNCLDYVTGDEHFILLRMDNIHEGIAGIVAGKIKDRFYRPVIIVTPSDDGKYKGTGRSIPGIDLYEVLNNCSELFLRFGGHKSACGFLMEGENYEALDRSVHEQAAGILQNSPETFERVTAYDAVLTPAEVTLELAKELRKLAPFGEGNPQPKFLLPDVIMKNVNYMGKDGTHARFYVNENNNYVNCVLFRKALEYQHLLHSGTPHDLIGSLSYQVWNGQERVQFMIEEII